MSPNSEASRSAKLPVNCFNMLVGILSHLETQPSVFGNDDESLKLMYVTAADTARIAIVESADGLWRIAGRVRFHKDPAVVERVLSKEGNVTFSTTEI